MRCMKWFFCLFSQFNLVKLEGHSNGATWDPGVNSWLFLHQGIRHSHLDFNSICAELFWRNILHFVLFLNTAQIAKFMGPTWGPPGSCQPQMGPMLTPWTLLSGWFDRGSKFMEDRHICPIVNIMSVDVLAMQGAKASAAMVLTKLCRNSLV